MDEPRAPQLVKTLIQLVVRHDQACEGWINSYFFESRAQGRTLHPAPGEKVWRKQREQGLDHPHAAASAPDHRPAEVAATEGGTDCGGEGDRLIVCDISGEGSNLGGPKLSLPQVGRFDTEAGHRQEDGGQLQEEALGSHGALGDDAGWRIDHTVSCSPLPERAARSFHAAPTQFTVRSTVEKLGMDGSRSFDEATHSIRRHLPQPCTSMMGESKAPPKGKSRGKIQADQMNEEVRARLIQKLCGLCLHNDGNWSAVLQQ